MTPARVREEVRPDGRAAAPRQRTAAGSGAGGVSLQRTVGSGANLIALQRTAGNRAVGMLLRQPTTQGAPASTRQPVVTRIDRDRARVVMTDGRIYEVTRVRRPVVRTERRRLPPGVGFGRDDDRVFVRIDWCRDTRGEIQLGANVPEVVREAVQQISSGIASGQGADAIRRAVEDAEIKPSVRFEIARSGEWQVEGEVEISIEGSGVTGGGGELTVRRGEWDVALEVRNQDGSTSAGLTVRWTPGRSNRRFTCPTREHVFLGQETSFVARLQTFIPPHTEQRTRQVQRQQEVTRYVYFDYATARIDERRSAQELAELRANLADGYRVSLVEGFTSPEGSHAPATGGRWQGNTRLAQERATAALERAQRECSSADGCLAGGDAAGAAEPELYTVVRDGEDVEGRELQESAVEGFLTSDAEARHRTPEVLEALENARTPAQRARIIYPLLRRSVVHLTRTVTETETYDVLVPGRTELGESTPAPPDVERAVIPHFQVQDVLR